MARILRLPAVIDRTGKTRSPIYADIQAGLFPRPIKLGARAAGWVEHEVEQIIAARICGANDGAIRRLVAKLHEARGCRFPLPRDPMDNTERAGVRGG